MEAYRELLREKLRDEWSYLAEVPYNARDEAMKEARANIKSAITNVKRGHIKHFTTPFRLKKNDTQTLPVRAQNITKDLHIYPRMLFTKELVGSDSSKPTKHVERCRKKTNYDASRTVRDSRLLYKRRAKEWYLCLVSKTDGQRDGPRVCDNQATPSETPLSETTPTETSPSLTVASLDPGNRTFFTWFSPTHGIGKVGEGDGQKLIKICLHLDALYGKRAKATRHKKGNLNRAIAKLRKRLESLRDDFHRKVSSWLTRTFDVIVLPVFNTHLMARRGQRKIGTKTVRGLMTWAHGKFRQTLSAMCLRTGTALLHPSEAYTSKTCSTCGWVDQKLGGQEVFRCVNEHKNVDRDVNGARGILLRALLGGALCLQEQSVI